MRIPGMATEVEKDKEEAALEHYSTPATFQSKPLNQRISRKQFAAVRKTRATYVLVQDSREGGGKKESNVTVVQSKGHQFKSSQMRPLEYYLNIL